MLSSDEDVVNATISTLKIFEKAKCRSNIRMLDSSESSQNKCGNELNLDTNSLTFDSLSGQEFSRFNLVDCEKLLQNNYQLNCSQYQNVHEALEVINSMYSFYQKKKSQIKDESLLSFVETFKDIIVPSVIQTKIDAINQVLEHMKIISESKAKLKQVLRSNVMNDFWKIRKEYHKNVVAFFTVAQEVMSDVSEFLETVEESKKHNPSNSKNIQLLETKILAELHENIEIVTEFRNYIQSLMS